MSGRKRQPHARTRTQMCVRVCVVRVTVCVSALCCLFHTQHVVWFSVTMEIKAAGPTGGGRV